MGSNRGAPALALGDFGAGQRDQLAAIFHGIGEGIETANEDIAHAQVVVGEAARRPPVPRYRPGRWSGSPSTSLAIPVQGARRGARPAHRLEQTLGADALRFALGEAGLPRRAGACAYRLGLAQASSSVRPRMGRNDRLNSTSRLFERACSAHSGDGFGGLCQRFAPEHEHIGLLAGDLQRVSEEPPNTGMCGFCCGRMAEKACSTR